MHGRNRERKGNLKLECGLKLAEATMRKESRSNEEVW
jgi:hypothetical protein